MNEGRVGLWSPFRVDAMLTGLVATVAYLVAHRALSANYRVAPAIEDLFAACTGRPGWVPNLALVYRLPEWTAFLDRKIAYFPCDAIKDIPLLEVGVTWDLQRYFHLVLSTWFRIIGPTVEGFITFQSASYAVTCALAFLIFRLGIGRVIAVACTAGFVWSSSHLSIAGLPIEYSKAPWVIGVVLLCAVIVLRDAAGKSVGWAALALGLVAGVGIGFKPDLIAVVPLAVLTPILFVGAMSARGFKRKAAAVLLVSVGVTIGGGSMLYRNFVAPAAGSLFPIQVLGGQDWQTESFHASSLLYDYGLTWDDSHVTWLINSYGHRVLGKTAISGFFSKEMQDVATRLLVDLWTTFPGDLVLRVMAATIRVVRLDGFSPYVALAGIFLVFVHSRRCGWFVLLSTVYLSSYVSLVFQRRHIFHLEFISWLLAGIVVQSLLATRETVMRAVCEGLEEGEIAAASARWMRPARDAAISLVLVAGAAWAVLAVAREYQQHQMIALVEHYQLMPEEPREIAVRPRGSGEVTVRIAGVSLEDRAVVGDVPTSDYIVAHFQCRSPGIFRVKSKYLPPVVDWNNWNRDFDVICADATGETTLMIPIYQYGADYRFDGLVMKQDDAVRLMSVATMRADPSVRLWLNLLVPSDWSTRRWFETMKSPPAMP